MIMAVFQHLSRRSLCARARLLLGVGLAVAGNATAQTAPADSLGGIARKLRQYEQRGPHEKLFLHLDRPVYFSGETMWFKIYAVEGTHTRPLALSSVAYVEVLDAEQHPVLQSKVALKSATGQGSFVLPAALAAGSYTVRAYTNWMKNFGPEAYFHTSVTVINAATASGASSKDSTDYEARFFPEGGNLVQNLTSKVAVKVTDKTGKGLAATGRVLSQSGAVVATFNTLRLGMGAFAFTPVANQGPYTAVLTLGNGPIIRRPLPPTYEQGYVLHLDSPAPDKLTLTVSATSSQPETLFLLGHSRQKVAVALRAQLRNGQAVFVVDKAQLLDGVSHFTLFNAAQRPVCERLYFQRPQHRLAITAQADKRQYATRDKVLVQVATPNAEAANLSMAVYRLDSLNTAPAVAIDRYLWLTADLKGAVENPDYYFTAGPEATETADHLMLTQGWSRFRWEDVLAASPKPFAYLPEPNGPVLRGQLRQVGTTQPRVGVMTYLASPSRTVRLSNAQSDADGRVQFELNDFMGPQEIIVQTDPQQDSTCQVTLFDPFSQSYSATTLPYFGLTARFQGDYAKRHLQAQVQNVFAGPYRNRFAPLRADSTAFFGSPDESYLLDKFTRFKVLEEVLREYVPGVVVRIQKDGFHLRVADRLNKTVMTEKPLVLLDGVPVFSTNKMMAMNPLKIRKLEVVDSHYFHGLAVYNGIVSFTTYKGDLEGFPLDAHALVQQYEGVQRQREFYAPRYDTPQAAQSRLPDLRNLLYWNPAIITRASARTLEFYTGDQAGRYLVVLQGLAADGLAGSTSFVLEVKQPL